MTNSEVLIVELYELFRQRYAEVKRYIGLTEFISSNKITTLSRPDGGLAHPAAEFLVTRELTKTLRANAYLLLYNFVEATMTNAIDAIHKSVAIDNLGFDGLSRDLQNIALNHFKRALRDDNTLALDDRTHPIQIAMTKLGYNKNQIFSGNVDCREIRHTAVKYGFKSPDPNLKGRSILRQIKDVKDKRNALAHGRLSFEQCGHDVSPEYLAKVSHETAVYLRSVLWSVSYYLRQRSYAAATPA